MVKGKISDRKAMNIAKSLQMCEDLPPLSFLVMTEMLLEFILSGNKSKRMGLFELKSGNEKNESKNSVIKFKVRMPKSSLEEGGLLAKILELYAAIRSGERTDVEAMTELLKLRAQLFVRGENSFSFEGID